MIKQTTQQIAKTLHARLFGDGNVTVSTVSTDTRQAVEMACFLR